MILVLIRFYETGSVKPGSIGGTKPKVEMPISSLKFNFWNIVPEILSLESHPWNPISGISSLKSYLWNRISGMRFLKSYPWNPISEILSLESYLWNPFSEISFLKSNFWSLIPEISSLKSYFWNLFFVQQVATPSVVKRIIRLKTDSPGEKHVELAKVKVVAGMFAWEIKLG